MKELGILLDNILVTVGVIFTIILFFWVLRRVASLGQSIARGSSGQDGQGGQRRRPRPQGGGCGCTKNQTREKIEYTPAEPFRGRKRPQAEPKFDPWEEWVQQRDLDGVFSAQEDERK